MNSVRIAIVDDDPHDSARIEELLQSRYKPMDASELEYTYAISIFHSPHDFLHHLGDEGADFSSSNSIVNSPKSAHSTNSRHSTHSIHSTHEFDVLFLDIEMPGTDGMQLARKIRDKNTDVIIVFTTRMAQYAVDGYLVDAAGYMVKPITQESFDLTMRKVDKLLTTQEQNTIQLHTTDGTYLVQTSDIYYVEVRAHNVYFHTNHGVYKTWDSLKSISSILNPEYFAQISRYEIVNLAHVKNSTDNTVTVNDAILQLSRARKKSFLTALKNYYSQRM